MPKQVDHAVRRREIVHALWSVIFERGLDGVTLRAVADAGGVSIGRVQHYFDSREDLVLAGCREMVRAAQETLDIGADEPAEALRKLLRSAIPTTTGLRLGSSVWYAYLAKSVSDPAVATIVTAAMTEAHAAAEHLIRAAASNDPALGADASAVAERLLSLADGLAQRVLVGHLDAERALTQIDNSLTEHALRTARM